VSVLHEPSGVTVFCLQTQTFVNVRLYFVSFRKPYISPGTEFLQHGMVTVDTRTFDIRVNINYMGQFVDTRFVLDTNTTFIYNLIIRFVFQFSAPNDT